MLNIKLEITDDDIKKYLSNHKYDKSIRYKEALFLKYMKETGYRYFTYEMFEMLYTKINGDDHIPKQNKNIIFSSKDSHLENFDNYLKNSSIGMIDFWHMLIPVLGYYKEKLGDLELYNPKELMDFIPIPYIYGDDYEVYLYSTIDNYQFVDKIVLQHDELPKVKNIVMDSEECLNEMKEYSKIYSNKTVEEIKKLVKGRV